ncbi:MAG: TetR family transcriptional regulator [Caulobacterales bacterium]
MVSATLEIVASKGFAAASLDEIAARAVMTKGAIYSNFASKAELLLAAMAAKGLTLSSGRAPARTIGEELAAMAQDLAATLRRAKGEEMFLAEFQLYALSDPELRAGLASVYSDAFGQTAAYLARLTDVDATVPPRRLAVALQAVAMGLLVQSFITPSEVDEAVVLTTMKALAEGLARRR